MCSRCESQPHRALSPQTGMAIPSAMFGNPTRSPNVLAKVSLARRLISSTLRRIVGGAVEDDHVIRKRLLALGACERRSELRAARFVIVGEYKRQTPSTSLIPASVAVPVDRMTSAPQAGRCGSRRLPRLLHPWYQPFGSLLVVFWTSFGGPTWVMLFQGHPQPGR